MRSHVDCGDEGAHHGADVSDRPNAFAPDDLAEKARIWALHGVAAEALRRATELGAKHGFEVVPVKGVLSARVYYADPSERPMQDVDVRVTPRALGLLRRIAPTEHLKIIHDAPAYGNLVFDFDGIMLEVEASVGPPGVCALAIETMIERASLQTATFGFECLEPELHDHALLLAVNAFKDKLADALPWALRDLELVVARPGFDAERFAKLARATNVATLVWIVAGWLAAKRDDREGRWTNVQRAIGRPPRERYARAMLALMSRAAGKKAGFVERNALRVAVRAASDSWRGNAKALAVTAKRTAEITLGVGIELK